MTERFVLFAFCMGLASCSLFEGDTQIPDFTITAPLQEGREIPSVKIGSTIEVAAELEDDRELASYTISLYKASDNRNALHEISHQIPARQKRYPIDTLFAIPAGLAPSSYDRAYQLAITVEDKRGNSVGKAQILRLLE